MIRTQEEEAEQADCWRKAFAGRCRCMRCGGKLISIFQICECSLAGAGTIGLGIELVDDGVMTVDNERPES